jgi:hypothetical protein
MVNCASMFVSDAIEVKDLPHIHLEFDLLYSQLHLLNLDNKKEAAPRLSSGNCLL